MSIYIDLLTVLVYFRVYNLPIKKAKSRYKSIFGGFSKSN